VPAEPDEPDDRDASSSSSSSSSVVFPCVFSSTPSSSETIDLPDTKYVIFHGTPYTLNQLHRLKPPAFMNDAVLHFFFQYLLHTHHRTEQVYIFDTQLWLQLTSITYGGISQALTQKKLIAYFEFDMLVVPVNIVGYHWLLMIVFINHESKTGTIVPLDSMSSGNKYNNYHAVVIQLLNTVSIHVTEHTQHTQTHTFMRHTYSCAICIMKFHVVAIILARMG
jgi:Ulp1 family protease